VAQADTEDGDLAGVHQLAEMVHRLLAMCRVTRAVRDEDAVEVVGHFVDRVIEGEARHAGATADKAAEDVLLDTAVDDSNVGGRVGGTDMEGGFGANPTDKIDLLGVHECGILIFIVFLSDCDSGQRRPLLS
jgi:hypothetical protein